MVVRLGIPPGMPGFQVVRRASGMMLPSVPTLTVAMPVFVGSATLVAMTVYVPGTAGATYAPVGSTLPPPGGTDQVTAVEAPAALPGTGGWEGIVAPGLVDPPGRGAPHLRTGAAAREGRVVFDEPCRSPAAGR